MTHVPPSRPAHPISRRAVLGVTGGALAFTALGGSVHAAAAAGYQNPVEPTNHPDPAVLYADGAFYLYSTAGSMGAMPVLTSPDLINWTEVGNGMPVIASWSVPGRHWAPEVIEVNGGYHSYYTARRGDLDQQAVSVSVADSPSGPFVDERTEPLVAQTDEGGSIDASPFRDADGSLWLLWKNDGNAKGLPSYIYLQRLTDDGLQLQGEPQRIIGMDRPYEKYTIEGASVVIVDGVYYCLYSTGEYWNESYGVCWASAPSITGPWTKGGDGPILIANDVASGPGHGMPIKVGPHWWYVYHAWQPSGEPSGRLVWLSRLKFTDDGPVIDGPTVQNPLTPKAR
ncbi:glycoside hydrolase family 43 protein [Microlunatus soli]|uniref:Glycosyl hydrolases family 43 n=1 Tax=Microlunatus soli TaxID=630515 RepID=A0A1H1YB88_9ACTN|nr:glycoside hydrolase family 43 protein [Microlunatus soli]SDT18687.1 Glycosyl hydrolases family 43 [Microlunatus soli]